MIKGPKYVVVAVIDGDLLYWSNVDGWGSMETRTVFTEFETRNLDKPMGGMWVLEEMGDVLMEPVYPAEEDF